LEGPNGNTPGTRLLKKQSPHKGNGAQEKIFIGAPKTGFGAPKTGVLAKKFA